MFNNVVFDVVIGLVFVFLLYSLLATVLVEIFTTLIGLRARNLKEAVDRMLNDEKEPRRVKGSPAFVSAVRDFFKRLWDSLWLLKNPRNPVIDRFYSNPEIRYLGSSGIFRNPSSFKAVSFSRTLLYILNGSGPLEKNRIDAELRSAGVGVLGKETCAYVLSLWEDAHVDLTRFRVLLENWFDRTMEQATEWYKRKVQVILVVLGFLMAACFNADTFVIVGRLANDKEAREQMVTMAAAYLQNNRPDTFVAERESLDTLLAVKKRLEQDIARANAVLGVGSWLPDVLLVSTDPVTKEPVYSAPLERRILQRWKGIERFPNGAVRFHTADKWMYLAYLLVFHFWGFLVTALAISLGAPFWFDLLNKIMKLRTSEKQPTTSPHTSSDSVISPLKREG